LSSGLLKRVFCWWLGYGLGAALAAYACATAGVMGREAAKRGGGDGPPVEGGWQTFGVWVVQGWFGVWVVQTFGVWVVLTCCDRVSGC
jgi:hypothetical protein